MKKKEMKNKSKFWKIYRASMLVLAVLAITVWAILWLFLDSYEKSQPANVADDVITWVEEKNVNRLLRYVKVDNKDANPEETLKAILKTRIASGKFEYRYDSVNSTDDKPVYVITKDKKDFAKINLYLSHRRGIFNSKVWLIKSIDGLLGDEHDISIVVPSNVEEVQINGLILNDKYIKDKDSYPSDLANVVKYVDLPAMYRYEVKGVYGEPFIQVIVKGNKAILSSEEYEYVYPYYENEELFNATKKRLNDFIVNYTRYVECERGFGAVSPYLLYGSKAYSFLSVIQKTNIWVANHTASKFSDISYSNMKVYSDSAFSIEAKYTFEFKTGSGKRTYDSKLTLYLVKKNGTWYVVDMTT